MTYKKSYRHIGEKTIEEIVTFIDRYKSIYTVKLICKALNFSRSTYYKALLVVPSKRQVVADRLKTEIKKIWLESKSRYGVPKIYKVLLSKGENVNLKRIQRYMKNMNIQFIVVKKFRYHSEIIFFVRKRKTYQIIISAQPV